MTKTTKHPPIRITRTLMSPRSPRILPPVGHWGDGKGVYAEWLVEMLVWGISRRTPAEYIAQTERWRPLDIHIDWACVPTPELAEIAKRWQERNGKDGK